MTRWRSTPEAHELRTLTGRLVAKVTPMVGMYRSHLWDRRGYSTSTHNTVTDAVEWCNIETGKGN